MATWAQAPMSNVDRIELPLKANQQKPALLPLERHGFILWDFEEKGAFSTDKTIKLDKYDTAFQLSWTKNVKYDKRLGLKINQYYDNALYMVFNDELREELQVIKVGVDGKVEPHNFLYLKKLQIEAFIAKGQKVYLAGTLKKLPVLLELDLDKNRIKPLPMAFGGKVIRVEALSFVGENAIAATVIMEQAKRKSVIVRTMEINGRQLEELRLLPKKNHDFLSAKKTTVLPNEQIIIGTYAIKNEESAQGIYVGKYNKGQQEYIKYHDFVDLNNFFAFMEEKDQEKIEERVKRKQEKGKTYKVKYQLLAHDVISKDGNYIMVGEAYYPVYRTERVSSDMYYGRRMMYTSTRRVLDGYQYTHAVVAVLDRKGNLLWDNSFKIDDTKTMDLKERVKVYVGEKDITLAYNLEGQVKKLIVTSSEVLQEDEMVAKNEFDNVKDADLGDSAYWFNRNFIAWGYQKIINNSGQVSKKKRRVFYVNKLAF